LSRRRSAIGGKVYVFGGFVDSGFHVTKRVDMYDPSMNTWTQKGNMPAGLAETHLGVTDDGTYLYFAGGFAGDLDTTKSPTQTALGTVWRYNPANDSCCSFLL
jgi:N-acetylneuraminic acid mutarotase